jgi:hypothetical protein
MAHPQCQGQQLRQAEDKTYSGTAGSRDRPEGKGTDSTVVAVAVVVQVEVAEHRELRQGQYRECWSAQLAKGEGTAVALRAAQPVERSAAVHRGGGGVGVGVGFGAENAQLWYSY